MLQHSASAGDEGDGLWLPLTQYAVKSGISTSTIRRKIKANSILYRVEKGRYLILFNESNNALARQPTSVTQPVRVETSGSETNGPTQPLGKTPSEQELSLVPLMEKTVHMVTEVFEQTLKEKDGRIYKLEKRNGELELSLAEVKTLVHALEEKYNVRY